MEWSDVVRAALDAARRGDRDTFETLLEAPNQKFQKIRDSIRAAGEALLEPFGAPPAPTASGVDLVRRALGIGAHGRGSADERERAAALEQELTKRIVAHHPDRLACAGLPAEEQHRRLSELATAHTALLLNLRTLVSAK